MDLFSDSEITGYSKTHPGYFDKILNRLSQDTPGNPQMPLGQTIKDGDRDAMKIYIEALQQEAGSAKK